MNLLTDAVLKAGLITPGQLEEIKRFRPPNLSPDAQVASPKSLEEAVALVDQALQSEGFVLVRETDLEVVNRYLHHALDGVLHVFSIAETEEGAIPVRYALTQLGEYIIPWRSESIEDVLTNGMTYLVNEDGVTVYFQAVRELFFGQQKAFMVLTPRF